ncbi:S1 family peptidase [Vibrio algivorus]|uniref:Effector protein n=1 Tax=Vibrio algivorus TaxID=1667024 RepID=A0ABQ6EN22_9VIBR|nr:serine protease [Vibrio algivorus]GLT14518.1 effector protein [Vibrio algivorus]
MNKKIFNMERKLSHLLSLSIFSLCGFSSLLHAQETTPISPYIINGNTVLTTSFPYMGVLITDNVTDNKRTVTRFCGGTLLNEQYVLTAAHCLYSDNPSKFKNLAVVFNVNNVDDDIFNQENTYAAKEVYYHDDYTTTTFQNDIAIIKLISTVPESVVSSADYVKTAVNENYRMDGQLFTAIGYGKTGPQADSANSLQEVQIEYLQPDQCEQNFDISDKQICVIGEEKNSLHSGVCGGDSGGPLLYEEKGQQYQAGIVSYGPKECGDLNVAVQSVYTEVYDYADWVANVLNGSEIPKFDVTKLEEDDNEANSSEGSSGGGTINLAWLAVLLSLLVFRKKTSTKF